MRPQDREPRVRARVDGCAKDLAPAIGRENRVYEILNHKRNLTLPMIRKLHTQFGIPLRSLVGGLIF